MNDQVKLGEVLLSSKLITEAQLKTALETQKQIGGKRSKLGAIIVKLGYLNEDQLAAFLAEQAKAPFVKLKDLVVQPKVSQLLDVEALEKHHLLPLRRTGDSLVVAVEDPLDLDGLDEIHFLTGLRVEPCVASHGNILKAIDYYCHNRPCAEIQEAEKAAGLPSGLRAVAKGETRAAPQAVLQALTELLIEKKVITQQELLKKLESKKQ